MSSPTTRAWVLIHESKAMILKAETVPEETTLGVFFVTKGSWMAAASG